MKGVMARMHKLNFLSGIEGSNEIEFPRLQKRLLQCEEETTQTFELFDHDEIDKIIYRAKAEAVAQALMCGIAIPSYDDVDILEGIVQVIESAVTNDVKTRSTPKPPRVRMMTNHKRTRLPSMRTSSTLDLAKRAVVDYLYTEYIKNVSFSKREQEPLHAVWPTIHSKINCTLPATGKHLIVKRSSPSRQEKAIITYP